VGGDGKAARSYSVPALDKALDIVELLARAPDPLTLSGIAGALQRSTGEIFRVLRTLEARGYLAREAGDGYVLTNRLFEQGLRRPATASLLEIAYPEMRRLAEEIRQSCHVSVPSGGRMVTVARVENRGAPTFTVPIGFSMPVDESASGRVYLAFLQDDERDRRLAGVPARRRATLRARLAGIRERGFEVAPSPGAAGITDLSFPLFEADARPAAFLAVPAALRATGGRELEAIVSALRRAAERIDQRMARLRRPAGG
jgi:DNA-binding IclR family transcriptional regulator